MSNIWNMMVLETMITLYFDMLNLPSATLIAVTLITIYFLYVIIYNIYFHPLSKFPGPKFAAATKIPVSYVSWNGSLAYWIKYLHDVYDSDVVRISPDELSFISGSAWKDILNRRPGHKAFSKDLVVFGGHVSIITANDADHSRFRRLLSHGFSDRALREQESLVRFHIDKLVHQIRKSMTNDIQNKGMNLAAWANYLTFDVISHFSFGTSFNTLEDSRHRIQIQLMYMRLKLLVYTSVTWRFPPLGRLLKLGVPKSVIEAQEVQKDFIVEKVDQRMAEETTTPDFLHYILRHNDEKGMTRREIYDNASALSGAGSESMGSWISGTLYLLLDHPNVYRRACSEIRGAFPVSEDINLESILELPYLHAVLDESLRVYPTALAGQARVVHPEGDYVSGHWISGGTKVLINQFAAFRSPRNFKNPDSFQPERWLDEGKETFQDDQKDVFQPFSIGARNCIGKNLAQMEIRLTIATLLWHFDIEFADPAATADGKWLTQKHWLTWQKPPLMVKFRESGMTKGEL